MAVPKHITHYYSLTDRPFQNLSELDPEALSQTLANLRRRKAENQAFKRVFGSAYMDFRRKTETKLRHLFEARGGRPKRRSPHYFVLGECDWFAGLYPDPGAVTLDWRTLPQESTSFTYPDSFISMRFGPEFGLPDEPPQPYHEKVFFLDELSDVVAKYGLPNGNAEDDYTDYHTRKFEKYVEIQLWTDDPVLDFLQTDR